MIHALSLSVFLILESIESTKYVDNGSERIGSLIFMYESKEQERCFGHRLIRAEAQLVVASLAQSESAQASPDRSNR